MLSTRCQGCAGPLVVGFIINLAVIAISRVVGPVKKGKSGLPLHRFALAAAALQQHKVQALLQWVFIATMLTIFALWQSWLWQHD